MFKFFKDLKIRGKILLVSAIIVAASIGYLSASLIYSISVPPMEVSAQEQGTVKGEAETKTVPQEEDVFEAEKFRRSLDGVFVSEEEKINERPLAVMIENHRDARPQSGLAEARLVWEVPVEGMISRFLAFYNYDQEVDEIGPVRSARTYYLEWAKPFDPLFVHVGGAPDALKKIDEFYIRSLNQMKREQYFWRSNARPAPHNVYTSTDLLKKAFRDLDISKDDEFDPWQYKDEAEAEQRGDDRQMIKLPYFEAMWKYSKEDNEYTRYMGNTAHSDADSQIVKAKNLVVCFMYMKVVDDALRKYIDNIGKGDAIAFMDGRVIEGEWRKQSIGERMRIYDEAGNEVEFNGGITWIEALPLGAEVEY